MSFNFNMEEILTIAEQIERNGAEFYRKAAEYVSGSPNKDILQELALMEEQHEKTFASLKAGLSDTEKTSTTFDPENESAQYLKSLADIRIFFEKEIDVTDLEAILKEAIIAEKDSIVFYTGMKDFVSDKKGREKIDSVIKEEMGHIRLLANKLSELKNPKPGQAFA